MHGHLVDAHSDHGNIRDFGAIHPNSHDKGQGIGQLNQRKAAGVDRKSRQCPFDEAKWLQTAEFLT